MNCEMQYSEGEYFAGWLSAVEIIFLLYTILSNSLNAHWLFGWAKASYLLYKL